MMSRRFATMLKSAFTLSVFLVIAAAAPAGAQTVADQTKKAEALAADGKFVEALVAMDGAVGAIWDKSPLVCRRFIWVAEKAAGFGAFNPRETDVFKAGVDMLAYAEPIGFGWRKSGDLWRTDMTADLIVHGKDGKVLVRKNDFGKFEIASRAHNREFMLNLTYTISGTSPGEYIIETRLHDKVTGKEGSCSLPYVVR